MGSAGGRDTDWNRGSVRGHEPSLGDAGRPWDVQAWSSGEGPAGGRHLGDVPAKLVLSPMT